MSFVVTLSVFAVIFVGFYLYDKRATRLRRDAKPPVTVGDFDQAMAALEGAALPVARVTTGGGETAATASRLGGQPWAPDGDSEWPQDEQGRPLFFLAQINFADLSLSEFPDAGLLQVFSAWHTPGMPDMSDDGDSNLLMRWFEHPSGDRRLAVPEVHRSAKLSMFSTERARLNGLGLTFEAGTALGNPFA